MTVEIDVVPWDVEDYLVFAPATTTEVKPGNIAKNKLPVKDFTVMGAVDKPCVVVDIKDRILAWFLPRILIDARKVCPILP